MARGIRRGVVSVMMMLTGAMSIGVLAGCGAAPESVGESDEALPKCNPRIASCVPEKDPPPPPPPVCRPHGEHGYAPPTPPTPSHLCLADNTAFPTARDLNASTAFEASLMRAGCNGRVKAVGGGPAIPPGGVGWSYTQCADTCAVRGVVHAYHAQDPFVAKTSDVMLNGCSGVPAAGNVFVLWDPHCPSSCEPLFAAGI